MGITHVVSSFRRAETASIADCDTAKGGGSAPLRTYGPYRSDYGRLGEFPNLPPLLVRCRGLTFFSTIPACAFVAAIIHLAYMCGPATYWHVRLPCIQSIFTLNAFAGDNKIIE